MCARGGGFDRVCVNRPLAGRSRFANHVQEQALRMIDYAIE